MATTTQRIQLRRDTAANWTSNNPTLQAGEVGFETDTGRQKIGDGTTAWSTLYGPPFAHDTFRLTSNGTAIGPTIADFYGATSAVNLLAASVYEFNYLVYFLKSTAGTVTWTLTASSAPTLISGSYSGSPVTGIAAGAVITGYTGSRAATTAAFNATASVSDAVYMAFDIRAQVITNAATTFKLQVTSGAGTVTPQAGSFYTVRRIAPTSGSFA